MKDFVEVDAVHEKNKPNYFGKKGDTAKKHTSGTVKGVLQL